MIENKLQYKNTIPVIDRIKEDTLPLVMYGAGTMAMDVLDILNNNGINIADVVVDDEYYNDDTFLKEYPIKKFSQIHELYDRFSIILGRSDYSKAESLNGMPGLEQIYYLTSPIYKMTESITRDDIKKYSSIYNETYELLEDDLSKEVFVSWINARINDDASLIFPYFAGVQDYFDNDIWKITDKCSFLDIGAYTGDTISRYFSYCVNGYAWGFEADDKNFGKLKETVKELRIHNVELFNNVLWSKHTHAYWGGPQEKNQETGFVDTSDGTDEVELYTVDELMMGRSRKVGLLKINFPGADEVIKGAVNVIREDSPYLAIRVGFDKYEIATIPLWIKANYPYYRIYMRYNMCIPAGLCLYAVSGKNSLL